MKPGSPLSDVVRRVDLLADQARDFVAPARNIRVAISDQASSIVLDDGTGALTFGMTDLVHDQLSTLAERLCHEQAHRAEDLYQGDSWSELRDTSAPGLALDTHHFGTEKEDTTSNHRGVNVSTLASGTAVVAMAK
jgi:hypothetical protein